MVLGDRHMVIMVPEEDQGRSLVPEEDQGRSLKAQLS